MPNLTCFSYALSWDQEQYKCQFCNRTTAPVNVWNFGIENAELSNASMHTRGYQKSSWHHLEIKEPETSFWYVQHVIHKTSLKSHYAKLHISPTLHWLSKDQNSTIGRTPEILRFDQNLPFLSLCIAWQIMFSSYVHG